MDNSLDRIKTDLLELSDYAYGRLRQRLTGLTDEEYRWEPAPHSWSVRPAGDGTFQMDGASMPVQPPPLTTIAWRLCHLIFVLAGERNATWIGVTPVGRLERAGEPGTAAAAIDQLDRAYALFRTHVAATDPDRLTDLMGDIASRYAQSTRAAFVLHELDELIHHAAEVAALRDLYRATRPVEPFVEACERADPAAQALLDVDPSVRERHVGLVAAMAARENWPAVRLLVDLGFDVNASAGVSALHYAAGAGELPVVRLLVEHGADTAAIDNEFERPPVDWARFFGRNEVVLYLAG